MNDIDEIWSIRQAIFKIANERDKTLHTLPTIAGTQAVQIALQALPSVLPEIGLGTSGALDIVLRDVVPALAAGHSGPRL